MKLEDLSIIELKALKDVCETEFNRKDGWISTGHWDFKTLHASIRTEIFKRVKELLPKVNA